jgi:hypothetical protein
MQKRQRGRRRDVGRRSGLTLTSQDVEHDIGVMNPVTERYSTSGLNCLKAVGRHRIEDVDRLSMPSSAPASLRRTGSIAAGCAALSW